MNALPEPASSLSLPEVTICPECGQESPPEETYCSACGAALQSDPAPPPLTPLAPGARLADMYVIETAEPQGRENRYHAVQENDIGREVLLCERANEESESFRALIERTTGIAHPALLVPEQMFERDDRVYLVYPRVAGLWLAERIGRSGEREAVSWGVQLCQVLGFLHRR